MADVISSGVKTTEEVNGDVKAAEENGPEAGGAAPAEVIGNMAVVVVGKAEDMIDPETADTRLIGSAILPGLGRRL